MVYFPWVKAIPYVLPFGLGDKLAPEFNDFKRVRILPHPHAPTF